jgi:hypothetical protein
VDGLHHPFEDRIEELPGVLGVPVGQEFQGPLEVREQHGDLLAFAFEGAPGGEDLLGQVFGDVGFGGPEMAGGLWAWESAGGKLLAALLAEFGAEAIRFTATGAGSLKAGSALFAEDRVGRILGLAPGALHRRASRPSGNDRRKDDGSLRLGIAVVKNAYGRNPPMLSDAV